MGHRANLVLVDENGYRLFSCHWCAKSIPADVFWGAQFAIPFIMQQETKLDDWLDEVWAEGGVLVDTHQRHLLLYGGESLSLDIPLRRVYMALLQENWPDWTVQWAHDGIADLGAYVGLDRSRFAHDHPERYALDMLSLEPPKEERYTSIVGSFRFEDGSVHLFPIDDLRASDRLAYGPELVEVAKQRGGVETLSLADLDEFPLAGFHIDVAEKRLEFWSADDPGVLHLLTPLWPGWELIWLKDSFETQLTRLGDRLIFPAIDQEKLVETLSTILTHEDSFDPVKMIQNRVKERENQGHEVWVNPSALQFARQDLGDLSRGMIFDKAVDGWRRKHKA